MEPNDMDDEEMAGFNNPYINHVEVENVKFEHNPIVNDVMDDMFETETQDIKDVLILNNTEILNTQPQISNKEELNNVNMHVNSTQFECKKCEKVFKECEICGKEFKFQRNFTRHMKTHNKSGLFVCKKEDCKKTFTLQRFLTDHMKIHRDVFDYKCEKCGKAFKSKNSFSCHMKTHDDTRDFKCKLCGKEFKTSENFKHHLKDNHVGHYFQCEKCEKYFKTKENLSIHMKKHGIYDCFKCGEEFKINAFNSTTTLCSKCQVYEKSDVKADNTTIKVKPVVQTEHNSNSSNTESMIKTENCHEMSGLNNEDSCEEYGTESEYEIDGERGSESESDDNDITNMIEEDTIFEPSFSQIEIPSTSSQTTSRAWTNSNVQQQQIPFFGKPGLKVDVPGNEPIDYFNLIAGDELYDLIVRQSNLYAEELLANSKSENSRISRHKYITKEVFKVWLGLLLHMGTIKLNRLDDYWKKHYLFNIPAFSTYMSRDRFLLIMRCLHFNNNVEDKTSLGKITPLINYFNGRMEQIYAPERELTIDESVVLWKGRLLIRQRMKRAKYGIKLYMLGQSNGLALKIIIYGGSAHSELGGKNHPNKVVNQLMQGKIGVGHSIFMDKYYNSVPLVEDFLKQNTYITGTLSMNKKQNPEEVIKKELKRGESVCQYTADGICVSKWRERRDVLTISSEFDGQNIEMVNRRGNTVLKPQMVIQYSKFMSGVDFHEQMMAYYPIRQNTLCWYKKLGIHFFQTMLLNSYYLYISQNDKISFYDFRLRVIEKLLGNPPSFIRSMMNIHLPKHCLKDDHGKTKRKRCKYCWSVNGERNNTLFFCLECPEQPGLCLDPCFRLFHKYT